MKKYAMYIPLGMMLLIPICGLFAMLFIGGYTNDLAAAALSLICAIGAVMLLKRAKPHKGWKIATSVAAGLLFGLYALSLPFMLFAMVMGHRDIVDTVYSPNGRYRAELIDVDEGALGGDTLVLVYDERGVLNFGFCGLQKKPQTAYMGPWGKFKDMDLEWESDTVLLIDGRAYDIEEETP